MTLKAVFCSMGLFVTFGTPAFAQDMSWAEANKASVEAMQAGDLDRAADLAKIATDGYGAREGYNVENYANLALNEADILLQMGKSRQAARRLQETVRHIERTQDEPQPLKLYLIEQMAEMYMDARELDRGRDAYDQYIGATQDIYGEDHLQLAVNILKAADRTKTFEPVDDTRYLIDWAGRIAANYPETHPAVIYVKSEDAKFELELRNYSRAEEKYDDVLALLEETAAAGQPVSPEVEIGILGQVAYLYESTGEDEKVDPLIKRAISVAPDSESPQIILRVSTTDVSTQPPQGGTYQATVQFDITREGRTENVEIAEKSGWSGYDRTAVKAAERWRFIPPKIDGVVYPVTGVQAPFGINVGKDTPTGSRISR